MGHAPAGLRPSPASHVRGLMPVNGLRPVRDGDTLCPVMGRLLGGGGFAACACRELVMPLPRSAADVFCGHVPFEVECIARMSLNVYIPQLQNAPGLVIYTRRPLGKPVASTAALAPVT